MRSCKLLTVWSTALGISTLAAAQLQGFSNTGVKTANNKAGYAQDQQWKVTYLEGLKSTQAYVAQPFSDPADKVGFLNPGKSASWICYDEPATPGAAVPINAQMGTYIYATTFTVGPKGANNFTGQYASFENVTSLVLNGMNAKTGNTNTFNKIDLKKPTANNSYNLWTDYSFGNLKPGDYTLTATVSDVTPSGLTLPVVPGLNIMANPEAFVLHGSATTPVTPEPPGALVALPFGVAFLWRSRKRAHLRSQSPHEAALGPDRPRLP